MSDYYLLVKFALTAEGAARIAKVPAALPTPMDDVKAHIAFGEGDECLFRAQQPERTSGRPWRVMWS